MLNRSPLELATERSDVWLRELTTPQDDAAYFEAVNASRPELDEFDHIAEKYQTIEDVRRARFESQGKLRMGIWCGEVLVGTVNLRAGEKEGEVELGYWTSTPYAGKGYATVAARALSRFAADHYQRVFATVKEKNVASQRVLTKAGYHYRSSHEGILEYDFSLVAHDEGAR